jgi:hemolysin activation/secretion protein
LRFAVRGFAIEGDLPIPAERAQAVLKPYVGEAVRLEDLQSAARALESELSSRGYSFYRISLPPQSLEGVVTLKVLPFRLANIEVTGNQYFSKENVLASLPALKPGVSPNAAEVGRNRSAANEHASKDIDVAFRPSDAEDSVDAEVTVRDQPPYSFFLSANNIGDGRTGDWRTTLGFQHSNLWDRDHAVTATYTTSPDHVRDVRQYGLYYRAPFYAVSGALTLLYAYSDVNSGTIANAFEVSGRGRFSGAHWRQHLTPIGAYSHVLEVGVDDRFFNNNVIFGTTQLGVNVRSRPVSIAYQPRYDSAESVLTGSVRYAQNLPGGGDNTDAAYAGNRAGATRSWHTWQYSFDGQWRISSWFLNTRVRGQLAYEPLIPGEQFGLGGAASVRGMRERAVTGDAGTSLTVEGIVPLPLPWEGFNGVVFADGGEVRVKNTIAGQPAHQQAASFGVGLRWSYARSVSLAIDAAHVVKGTTASEAGDRRIHASLLLRF